MKLFIGGYYINGLDLEMKGLAFTKVKVLTLKEALKEAAIENVVDWYNEKEKGNNFNLLSDENKMTEIEKYVEGDEIFNGRFYGNKEGKDFIIELEENKKNY